MCFQLKQLCGDSRPAAGVRNAARRMTERKRVGVEMDGARQGEAPKNKEGSRRQQGRETL